MTPQENIPVHIRRRIHLIDKVIDNLLPNMYPCDYNSSDHFVEGVLDEVFYFLREEPNFYGVDLISINDFILDHKYDELTDYFNEHCIVLKNDNLQESIKRILREETNKPSENEFKQALKDVMVLIPLISHRILHDENIEHDKENMAELNKIILQKVKEGNDEILDEMWELAGSKIMKNAINIITFYTK